MRGSSSVLVLTRAINRNFEGFSSVICTTVVAKLKKATTLTLPDQLPPDISIRT